jgi:hypothetical protein
VTDFVRRECGCGYVLLRAFSIAEDGKLRDSDGRTPVDHSYQCRSCGSGRRLRLVECLETGYTVVEAQVAARGKVEPSPPEAP